MPRVDAREKASGAAKYAADVDRIDLVHAVCVRSPIPHARLLGIDTSAALAQPGVIGVFTADAFGRNLLGSGVRDIPIVAREKVRYVGERVAVVVAEDALIAELAAGLVQVEYEVLPAITSLENALAPGGPLVHDNPWAYPRAAIKEGQARNTQSVMEVGSEKDAETALQKAAVVVDRTYRTQGVHQGYLEPQACIAEYDPTGRYRVWVTHKAPYRLRGELAEFLGVDPDRIDIEPVFIGGDFGGKGTMGDAALCLELARMTGRAVKTVLRYSDDLISTNPRHPARTRIRVGCDQEGRLSGVWIESFVDGGAYAGTKRDLAATLRGILEPPLYRTPGFFVREHMLYTNTVPRGSMRAPGCPQVNFAFESALEELAVAAAIDPIALRRGNLLKTGDRPVLGRPWFEYRGEAVLDAALAAFQPLAAPDGWLYGRGLAIYGRTTRTAASTSMRILPVGSESLRVEVPLSETGTGSHTAVRQMLSSRLGYATDKIDVVQVSTSRLPRDHGASGSRVTSSIAMCIDLAVVAWNSRSNSEPIEVEIDASQGADEFGSIIVQIAQVGIDPHTGEVRVLEILSAIDVAEIVNPLAHQMQIDGAMAMGFGFACLEDLAESEGQVWAANLGEFKIPSHRDVPRHRTILVPGGKGVGAANVKNIGELANPLTAAAVGNAIFAASGCRIRKLPFTAERIFRHLRPEIAMRKEVLASGRKEPM